MKKLLGLKEWLTVPEAARHLSMLFSEEVSEADVLRLAIEGHLTLSVLFLNRVIARCGPIVPFEDRESRVQRNLGGAQISEPFERWRLRDGRVLELDEKVVRLDGVWDLTMLGGDLRHVENKCQRLTGGPGVRTISLRGPLLRRESGIACRLESELYKEGSSEPKYRRPAEDLPLDSVLVVRTAVLQEFGTRLFDLDKQQDKPLTTRERDTLLVIIAALARLAKLDPTKPSKVAGAIEAETIRMGARVAVRTIEGHLKKSAEALRNRAKY